MGGEGVAIDEVKSHVVSDPPPAVTDNDDKDGSDSDGDGAEEILEESPDKRWSKRREKVKQRDVPGIDAAFLAMDNETGNEVVWNEVFFSERKNFQEEKLKAVFDKLTHLVHVNLVKFHKYWTDSKSEKPRIIFITEYMSSGSMSRFLQRTRSSGTLLNIKAWKKWTTQILSALNYLHQCDPPIVHANLSCNTVFIQQNGLIKIGCVAPNAIHHHVKTFRENIKNMHYIAPEHENLTEATTQSDIYSFGICALEMAMTGALIGSNCNGTEASSSSSVYFGPEAIRKSIDALEDSLQKDFIERCLNQDPEKRPTARELLFHFVLFEVHSLKLIAAHSIINSKLFEQLGEDDLRVNDASQIAAESKFKRISYHELSSFQVDLEKFLEDVKNGIYPLIAFAPSLSSLKLNNSSSVSGILSVDNRGSHLSPEMFGAANNSSNTLSNSTASASTSHEDPLKSQTEIFDTSNTSVESGSNWVGGEKSAAQQFKNGYNSSLNSGSGNNNNGGPLNNNNSSNLQSFQLSDRDEGYHTAQSIIMNSTSLPSTVPPATNTNPVSDRGFSGEARLIQHMQASVDGSSLQVLLRLDDSMNRQLTTEISENDTAENLVIELVQHGFISEVDSSKICSVLTEVLRDARKKEPHRLNSPS